MVPILYNSLAVYRIRIGLYENHEKKTADNGTDDDRTALVL